MSLDVYLSLPGTVNLQVPSIWIREDGQTKAITRTEWEMRYPDRKPVVVWDDDTTDEVYHANITHNLGMMARRAGLYGLLWRPNECGVTHARQLIEPLKIGYEVLMRDPDYFQQFNPENGWGTYEGLVRFVEEYLAACQKYPDAEVSVWR